MDSGSDDLHPAGDGVPAYRVVFKTLKVVFSDGQEVRGPNFVIRFGHGDVARGGMKLPGAMPGRSFNQAILASEAHFRTSADGVFVDFRHTGNYEFAGWEDSVKNVFYAEFILATESSSAAGRIAEGRRRLASLKAMIDLRFGTRVLGVPIAEEVGALFDDWHFNRQIHSGQLGGEHQLDPREVAAPDLLSAFDAHQSLRGSLSSPARRSLDLACEWYWSSIVDGVFNLNMDDGHNSPEQRDAFREHFSKGTPDRPVNLEFGLAPYAAARHARCRTRSRAMSDGITKHAGHRHEGCRTASRAMPDTFGPWLVIVSDIVRDR